MDKVMVISVKPEYAAKIYAGEKKFEFRRVPPRNLKRTYVIYESAPVSRMTGTVVFCLSVSAPASFMADAISALMCVPRSAAIRMMGISEGELIEYAGGRDSFVIGLLIAHAEREGKLARYKIRPPQNWGTIKITGIDETER